MIDCNLISHFYYKKATTTAAAQKSRSRVLAAWCMCEPQRIKEHHPLNKRKLKRRKMSIEINAHFFPFCGDFFSTSNMRRGWNRKFPRWTRSARSFIFDVSPSWYFCLLIFFSEELFRESRCKEEKNHHILKECWCFTSESISFIG